MTAPPRPRTQRLQRLVAVFAAATWPALAFALAPPAGGAPATGATPVASGAAAPRAARHGHSPRAAAGPAWSELDAGQQRALAPLASQWARLSEAQKRKWIAMSANFPRMSGEEQAKLHSRMTEWVSLSPQQRSAARLNYGQTRKLAPGDKKAQWEAYQALPPEEKKKLAAGAQKAPSTAAALKPVPREKLASVPRPKAGTASKSPRIAAAPNQVDHNTLLPQQPPTAPPATLN